MMSKDEHTFSIDPIMCLTIFKVVIRISFEVPGNLKNPMVKSKL